MAAADVKVFQKVVTCADCHKIVETKLSKAARLLASVLSLYRESLRLALIKKQANLPALPRGNTMPMGELPAAMSILKVINANSTERRQTD